jgi:hypothetical protein
MWRQLRILLLLIILGIAAWTTLYDRLSTTDWDETLWIGVFPVNAESSNATADYIASLTPRDVAEIERFINREAKEFGIALDRPVRVDLFPEVKEPPPELASGANVFQRVWWSLRLRLYARRNARAPDRATPQIRAFVLFHDPSFSRAVPHSVGLQKGLVGVVHAFADEGMTKPNNVVIAHEILHTLGATDKYDPATLAPIHPIGYAEPEREPLHPQRFTEIMAGRRAIDAHEAEMPESLAEVVVGHATALEIGWMEP